jgi:hypothetical protein
MLTGDLLDAENAWVSLQRHAEPPCCAELRQATNIDQHGLRPKAEAVVADQSLDRGKPLPHPCGNPGLHVLLGAAENFSQVIERNKLPPDIPEWPMTG